MASLASSDTDDAAVVGDRSTRLWTSRGTKLVIAQAVILDAVLDCDGSREAHTVDGVLRWQQPAPADNARKYAGIRATRMRLVVPELLTQLRVAFVTCCALRCGRLSQKK